MVWTAAQTTKAALSEATQALVPFYESAAEAQAVAWLFLSHFYGWQRTDLVLNDPKLLEDKAIKRAEKAWQKLIAGAPVQYAIGEAWFYDLRFEVSPAVLIPRPETEELLRWAIESVGDEVSHRILDLCTGSGCLAISLGYHYAGARVFATDVSEEALDLAHKNARNNQVPISFIPHDLLKHSLVSLEKNLDLIVSNPPYVLESDAARMAPRVLNHEPHIALFPPGEDPLIFYRQIAKAASVLLRLGGRVFVETEETLAHQVAALLTNAHLSEVQVKADFYGKERFVSAIKTEEYNPLRRLKTT